MKVLKGIGLVFAKIFLVMSILLFLLSLSASYVLENGISSLLLSGLPNVGESVQRREMVNTEGTSQVDLTEVYNQVLSDLGITEEQLITILESPVVKDLVNEFVDTVLEDISTGDTTDFNLGEKVLDFVEDNKKEIEELIGEELPMDKIEEFARSEEVNQFNDQYKEVVSTVSGNIPEPVKDVIRIVEDFISEDFRESCLIISGVLLLVIALLQWSLYKWVRTLGNTILGCGIFVFIISLVGNVFAAAIATMANMNAALEFGKAIICGLSSIGCGVILLVVYMIIKKIVEKDGKQNEISQNAI